jgi:hypothetical protein
MLNSSVLGAALAPCRWSALGVVGGKEGRSGEEGLNWEGGSRTGGEELFWGSGLGVGRGIDLGIGNVLGVGSVHGIDIRAVRCVRFARFSRQNRVCQIRGQKLFVMFLQLPFVEDLTLEVPILHIEVHAIGCSMFTHVLRLLFIQSNKTFVRDWDSSHRP